MGERLSAEDSIEKLRIAFDDYFQSIENGDLYLCGFDNCKARHEIDFRLVERIKKDLSKKLFNSEL